MGTDSGMGTEVKPVLTGGNIPADSAAEIQRHLERNDTKSALNAAKEVHRRLGTPDSEALLVDVYFARIAAMRERGLMAEAASLTQLVLSRYRTARNHLQPAQTQPKQEEPWEKTIACLNDLGLDAVQRAAAEQVIRREVRDVSRLAACAYLPDGHSLRKAAGAVVKAFEAVTTGPVTDEQISLPEVSHRSPLADWKLLVRAIACLYGGDDQACRKLVDAMSADSAAARLMPAIRAILDGGAPAGSAAKAAPGATSSLSPAAGALSAAVRGGGAVLRMAIRDLDSAFSSVKGRKRLHEPIRKAVDACRAARPDLLDRLKQHISVRCVMIDYPAHKVVSAMGGPSRHDAFFWRLLARTMEAQHDAALACSLWEEFRRNALNEGLFQERSPDEAALYVHMLDLLLRLPDEVLEDVQGGFSARFSGYASYYRDQPDCVRRAAPRPAERPDMYFLDPEKLFERICEFHADSAVYARWLEYAKARCAGRKGIDDVAMRWHRSLPGDKTPLLHLMESAESRNAFDKALKFLQKAEALDAVDPAVKRARLRLWAAKALRHVGQGRWDLTQGDLEGMSRLPQASEGDRPAFLAAMRWLLAEATGQADQAGQWRHRTTELLGDELTAYVLLAGVAGIPDQPPASFRLPDRLPAGNLAQAAGRVCALGDDLAVPLVLPTQWIGALRGALSAEDCPADSAGLLALARAALRSGDPQMAFVAAGAGLRQGGPLEGRFLLLRGQSLPGRFRDRRGDCFAAVAELARRRRDMDLVAEAVDLRQRGRGGHQWAPGNAHDEQMSGEELAEVLNREKNAMEFPVGPGEASMPRRRSGGPSPRLPWPEGTPFDDARSGADEEADEEEADELDEDGRFGTYEADGDIEGPYDDEDESPDRLGLPVGVPPEMVSILLELMQANNGRPPSMAEVERIVRRNPELRDELLRVLSKQDPDFAGMPELAPSSSGSQRSRWDSREARRRRRKRERHSRGR